MTQERDLHFMRLAYGEAIKAGGNSDPNPAVGALVVASDGHILTRGFTQKAGYAHAERVALQSLRDGKLDSATLYVTLEPCCHHGRTPPCTDAIIEKGIERVVIAERDFAAEVMGKSVDLLRAQNIDVTVLPRDLFKREKFYTTGPFFHARKYLRPRVMLKWAQTADGAIAPINGTSGKISGFEAAAITAALRNYCKFTLATPGTALIDRPRLDVRYPEMAVDLATSGLSDIFIQLLNDQLDGGRQQFPDTSYRQPARGYLLSGIRTEQNKSLLSFQNAIGGPFELYERPESSLRSDLRGEMSSVLADVLQKGFNSILIEAGPRFSQSLIDTNLIDLVAVYRSKRHTADALWGKSGLQNSFSKTIAESHNDAPRLPEFALVETGDLKDDDFFLFQRQEYA